MNSHSTENLSRQISSKDCSLKVVNTCKVLGKINITVRLIKTPPASPINKIVQNSKNHGFNDSALVNSEKKNSEVTRYIDPTDFIEPVPCIKEFMQTGGSVDNELCDTLPILPRAYSIRPSVALRNSIRRRNKKNVFSPSPRNTMKTFVKFYKR